MQLPLYWIDAFASAPFTGNPAAVVPLTQWLPDRTLQQIAFENGLAETAFIVPVATAAPARQPRFHLRWFTPAVEVDLCGHATLATGHVILRELRPEAESVAFDSRSGVLEVTRRGEQLELSFPITPVSPETDAGVAAAVARALGGAPAWLGRSCFDRFAVLPTAETVRTLRPDFAAVAAAGGRGLIVTAPGDGTCDFVSRFFAPQAGIPEDPVTGSAHCALAPYWAERLGRNRLHARQLSPRGGELWCEVAPELNRVRIAGATRLYLRGEINLPG
ncbi:PhzF family phenazine biosynthesis protein [Opitutus sp. ER46]|uniref:PhzF family phenazine biosynthesis protein n=1 Tax=Opitutus sp. ER46 TaxID=2161864 RepID=UPI000D2F6110|nr:PhzF family phenazine biosynthesis protein [Opitutus sp. ER46]PTX91834.1 isomerase [Opitutus sp. ER46]